MRPNRTRDAGLFSVLPHQFPKCLPCESGPAMGQKKNIGVLQSPAAHPLMPDGFIPLAPKQSLFVNGDESLTIALAEDTHHAAFPIDLTRLQLDEFRDPATRRIPKL